MRKTDGGKADAASVRCASAETAEGVDGVEEPAIATDKHLSDRAVKLGMNDSYLIPKVPNCCV